jgi:hypothetical protein
MDIKKEDLIPDSTMDKDGDNMQRGVTNMPDQNTSGKTEEGDEDYDDEITGEPATDE